MSEELIFEVYRRQGKRWIWELKFPNNIILSPPLNVQHGWGYSSKHNALKSVKKAGIQNGDYVIIFGQGPFGLTITQLSKIEGGKVIAADLVDYRLEKAKEVGASYTVNASNRDLSSMVKEINIGLVGLGTIGSAFARELYVSSKWIEAERGIRLILRKVFKTL